MTIYLEGGVEIVKPLSMTADNFNIVVPIVHCAATIVGQGNGTRWVFGGGADKMVHKWNLDSGEWTSVLTGHIRDIHAVCAVPDQPVLLSTGRDGLVKIWYVYDTVRTPSTKK